VLKLSRHFECDSEMSLDFCEFFTIIDGRQRNIDVIIKNINETLRNVNKTFNNASTKFVRMSTYIIKHCHLIIHKF